MEVTQIARAIAQALGDNYDDAFANKSEWVAHRGERGGRFREINEPFRCDYEAAAEAALAAKEAELAAEIVEKIVRDLALTEIANFERASVEWLEGLRFARERVRATLAETQPERNPDNG